MAAAGRGASPSVQIIKAAGVWDNAIAAVGIDQRRCSEQLAGFFVVSHPIWQRREGFTVTHGERSACSPGGLRGRCGALGRPRLALLSFFGEIPPPRPAERTQRGRRGAGEGGGGTRGGKSMRAHGTKAIRRAGGEPAEGIGWEMKAGAEPGFH